MKSTLLPLLFVLGASLGAPLYAQDAPAAPGGADKIRSAKLFALHLTRSVGGERDLDRALVALAAWEGEKTLEVSGNQIGLALQWAGADAARPLRPLLRGASRVRVSRGRVQIERARVHYIVGERRGEPWLRVGLILRYEVRFKEGEAVQVRGPKGLSRVPYGRPDGRRRPYRVSLGEARPGISGTLQPQAAPQARTGPNDGKAQAARAARVARVKEAARAAKRGPAQATASDEAAQKRARR